MAKTYLFTIYQFGDPVAQTEAPRGREALEKVLAGALGDFFREHELPPGWPIPRNCGEPVQGYGVELFTLGGNRRVEIEARADREPFPDESTAGDYLPSQRSGWGLTAANLFRRPPETRLPRYDHPYSAAAASPPGTFSGTARTYGYRAWGCRAGGTRRAKERG